MTPSDQVPIHISYKQHPSSDEAKYAHVHLKLEFMNAFIRLE